MKHPKLSVKCSYDTGNYLQQLFLTNDYFLYLKENQVQTNISWFFKQSGNIFLTWLKNNPYPFNDKIQTDLKIYDYSHAFENQFATTLDDSIKRLIIK